MLSSFTKILDIARQIFPSKADGFEKATKLKLRPNEKTEVCTS